MKELRYPADIKLKQKEKKKPNSDLTKNVQVQLACIIPMEASQASLESPDGRPGDEATLRARFRNVGSLDSCEGAHDPV